MNGEDGLYATCNVFYRRGAYDAAGGFDPSAGRRLGFRPGQRLRALGFGEDTLLGWQVRRAGRVAFVAEAVVEHEVFAADPRDSVRRAWATGAFPALVREVPELRRTLLRGGFLVGRPARLALYGAVCLYALLGRRVRLPAAALLAVWAVDQASAVARDEPSWSRRARVVPADLLLDAVSALALVAGSVRARTLVL